MNTYLNIYVYPKYIFQVAKKKNPILNVQYCVDSNNTTTLEMEK